MHERLGLAAEVAIQSVKNGEVTGDQAMEFLVKKLEQLKASELGK